MKQVRLYSLIFAICFSGSVFAQKFKFNYHTDFKKILKRTQDVNDAWYYPKQLVRFQKNDTTLTSYEVLGLMIGYTVDTNYKPYDDIKIERKVYKLNGDGSFKKALKVGLAFHKTHPLNQMTLIELSYAYFKIGKLDSAKYYGYQYQCIMDAMGESGKGFKPDSAFFSLTPIDGQNFITKYIGGGKIGLMGSEKDSHGYFLDMLEYVPKDRKEGIPLYFNIEHAMKVQRKKLKKAMEKLKKKD